jgi:hypothetical protein
MANSPSSSLLAKIDEILRAFSPIRLDGWGVLKDKQQLEQDLRLYKYQRRALAAPFQRIAEDHRAGNAAPNITGVACEKLKTVKTARELVSKEAGYKYSGEAQ